MRPAVAIHVLALVPPALAAVMNLHMMPEQGLAGRGAVCLDGSDAGFYFAPAADPGNAHDWQIYFQGGGWCYDKIDCWGRSNDNLGSSKAWRNTSALGGIMSDDCNVNPDFCNFNRVHMVYCDGNSFSGNRDNPLVVMGLDDKPKPLYFRGRRILDATLDTLLSMGLNKAENVLLTGCSAGGLATFLHTDYVHDYLKSAGVPLGRYKAAPISGYFLRHSTVEGKPVYPQQMQVIYELANSTGGVNARCAAALAGEEAWLCNFAQFAYAYTEAPIFPLNSALDSWQTKCIYASELVPGFPEQHVTDNGECGAVNGFGACAGDPEQCSEAQVVTMNQFMQDFETTIEAAGTYHRPGNGAFVHSCFTHCEAEDSGAWNRFEVGGVSMRQAVSKWWNSEGEPASHHSYGACRYHANSSPHACNPSCVGGTRKRTSEELEGTIII